MASPGRPTRSALYVQLAEQVADLHGRLGGLPSPAEAEDIWGDIWLQEAHNSTALEGNTLVLASAGQGRSTDGTATGRRIGGCGARSASWHCQGPDERGVLFRPGHPIPATLRDQPVVPTGTLRGSSTRSRGPLQGCGLLRCDPRPRLLGPGRDPPEHPQLGETPLVPDVPRAARARARQAPPDAGRQTRRPGLRGSRQGFGGP